MFKRNFLKAFVMSLTITCALLFTACKNDVPKDTKENIAQTPTESGISAESAPSDSEDSETDAESESDEESDEGSSNASSGKSDAEADEDTDSPIDDREETTAAANDYSDEVDALKWNYSGSAPFAAGHLTECPNYALPANATEDQVRAMAIRAMNDELTFKWVPLQSFKFTKAAGASRDLTYNYGQTYGGLPYNNVARSLFHALEMYDYETGCMPGLDYSNQNMRFGNTCANSVIWGLAAIDPNMTASSTHTVCPGGGFEFVGNIKGYEKLKKFDDSVTTPGIIAEIGDAETYECYAVAKPADALLKHVTSAASGNHCMMVVNVNTVRNADGTINPDASTLAIQDQWSKLYADGGVSYCGRHKTFTFREMKEDGYIPLRARALTNFSGHEVARVTVTQGAKTFAEMGAVTFTCNYRAVVFSASLISESGTTVYYHSMENTKYSGSHSMASVVPSANALTEVMRKDRNYTFVLRVRLADGELFDVASIPLTLKDLE